jgi:hypothetical protein
MMLRCHTTWQEQQTGWQPCPCELTAWPPTSLAAALQAALQRLQREQTEGSDTGFRRSRRPMFGSHMVLLAAQKPGQKNIFSVCRPNTGDSYFDLDRSELDTKYAKVAEEEVKEEWQAAYESSLAVCMHGRGCAHGAACQVGWRLR